ncbi:MAG: substrate-binding periplasmic protein [Sediminispirochaetaceae bacterium]
MKNKVLILSLLILLIGSMSVLARGGQEEAEAEGRPVIKVASNVQIPLRIYFEGDEIKGYEYELYKEALNRAGYDVEVVDVAFAGIFAGLQAEKWSIAASNVFITKERAKEMDFSEPYLESYDCIIVRDDDRSIKGLEDLQGKVVGTEVGTTQAAYAEKLRAEYGPFEIRGFEDKETQFLDLELKRIDALTLGYPDAVLNIQERGMFEILGHSSDNFMIGAFFRKGDPLQAEFNAALQEMKKDGTVAKIYEQYFGEKPPAGSAPVRVFEQPYQP